MLSVIYGLNVDSETANIQCVCEHREERLCSVQWLRQTSPRNRKEDLTAGEMTLPCALKKTTDQILGLCRILCETGPGAASLSISVQDRGLNRGKCAQ